MKNKLNVLSFVVAAFAAMTFMAQPLSAAVETGAAAPDFTLTDSEGNEHSLSSFKDQYVVMEWLNHDCPFVKKHYDSGNMQKLQKTYTDKGVVWLSIISSAPGKQGYCTPEKASTLKQEKEANPTAVLLDPKGEVGKLYSAQTTPHMYIVGPDGTLIYQGAIDSIPSANPADVDKADNFVELALDSAMSGNAVENASTKSYGCSVKY